MRLGSAQLKAPDNLPSAQVSPRRAPGDFTASITDLAWHVLCQNMEIEQTQRDQTGEGGEGVADGRTEGRESREVAAALVSSPRREVRREREQGGGGSFGFFTEEGCEPSTGEGREGGRGQRSKRPLE